MVQVGYARCPRCSMPQPKAPAKAQPSGGTAIETEGSSKTTLIALALGVLVAAAIVIMLVMGREDSAKAPTEDESVAPPSEVANTAATNDVAAPIIEDSPNSDQTRELALTDLETALKGKRIWSTVTASPESAETVSIVSASCQAEEMKTIIDRHTAPLQAHGFTRAICLERHGGLVFEQDL